MDIIIATIDKILIYPNNNNNNTININVNGIASCKGFDVF